jgi:hypothetical protein
MMNRAGHADAKYFFGCEVECTPVKGMETLFVIGLHDHDGVDEIKDIVEKSMVRHVFFGANDSYRPKSNKEITAWENMIYPFLDRGLWCSLDIPFRYVEEFHEGGLCERDRFIPIIKVPIPYIKLWNYNTCVKIDDRDFAATNPGVWVYELRDLMARDRFTDWGAYEKDQVVDQKPDDTEVLDSQYPDGDGYWRAT